MTEVSNIRGGGGGSHGSRICNPGYNYPLFKQCDYRWGNDVMDSETICYAGCLMTSITMALNGRGKSSMNPGQMNYWLRSNNGYTDDLFEWYSVYSLGLRYVGFTTDIQTIIEWVCSGKVVVLNVRGGKHWVLAKSYSNGMFQVNDPGYNSNFYTSSQVVGADALNA